MLNSQSLSNAIPSMDLGKPLWLADLSQTKAINVETSIQKSKTHLIDSHTGLKADKILPSKVGWDGNVQNGLWIGWRDAKNGEVVICGNLDVEELINLYS